MQALLELDTDELFLKLQHALSSRLAELRDAKDNGLITDEEFQNAKKALIEGV